MFVIPITLAKKTNLDSDLCTPCGGVCCKRLPGGLIPEDLLQGRPVEKLGARLKILLSTGRYAVDWWNGNPFLYDGIGSDFSPSYFIRPAIQGDEGRVYDPSWGGTCTFHSDAGCSLKALKRPFECRSLIPKKNLMCGYEPTLKWEGKRSLAQAWRPFNQIVKEIADSVQKL